MSGVEVVGILLGAFPLLISAFEHYRDVAKTAGLLMNWEAEHRKSLNDVKDEELIFRQNMVLLLWPLVDNEAVEKDKLETLLMDPGGPGWKDENVKDALVERLGESMERYVEIMQELQASIGRLLKTLGFDKPKFQAKLAQSKQTTSADDRDTAPKFMTAANEQFLKRVEQLKFGLGRAAREEALSDIRLKNEKLEKLLRRSDKVARVQETKTIAVSRKASKSLLQYWEHAGRIYTLVQASWVCSCKQKHCAHLWLHHPSPKANELKLLILWSPETLLVQGQVPWRPRDLQITWVQREVLQRSAGASVSVSKADQDAGLPRKQKKRVKFSVEGPQVDAKKEGPRCSEKVSGASHLRSQLSSPEGRIIDLCKAMATCGVGPSHMGALMDLSTASPRYLVCSQPDEDVSTVEISLQDILQAPTDSKLKRRSDRFKIALAVASAHLQLRSTPWARRQWEARDILFPRSAKNPGYVMLDRPYVSANFNETLPKDDQVPKQTDKSFGCLGIMLLELCFGVALEDHEMWQMPGLEQYKTDPTMRSMVATKWSNDVEGEAGPEFAAAVTWCLRESPATLSGNQWRKDFANRVVMPLQHCWDWIKPKAAT